MLPKADRIRLTHMLDAAREAMGYAEGRSRGDIDTDTMRARALAKCLEIVGEAASRVSSETRTRAGDIPWAQIAGMRNRLIHAYFDIDLDEVWRTVIDDLPALANRLQAFLGAADREN
jgi:uncharacterized protein with HEPN domain